VRQFSIAHDAALAVLVAGCAIAIWAPRRHPGPWVRWIALALAAVILAGWVGEYIADAIEGIYSVRYTLPLQLTDAVSATAIVALLTRRQLFVELLYFWALSASLQAVLTPDLAYTFPNWFYFTYFMYHVGSIVAACLLVFGCRQYPRRGAMWWVFALTLAWAAVAGLGDVITGGNYMYLASKPVHNSLLNVLGPWPLYIASAAGVALIMLAILTAIARVVQRHDPVLAQAGAAEIACSPRAGDLSGRSVSG
jgi:hypothetical integral membrane protein (TIGR02206 family)